MPRKIAAQLPISYTTKYTKCAAAQTPTTNGAAGTGTRRHGIRSKLWPQCTSSGSMSSMQTQTSPGSRRVRCQTCGGRGRGAHLHGGPACSRPCLNMMFAGVAEVACGMLMGGCSLRVGRGLYVRETCLRAASQKVDLGKGLNALKRTTVTSLSLVPAYKMQRESRVWMMGPAAWAHAGMHAAVGIYLLHVVVACVSVARSAAQYLFTCQHACLRAAGSDAVLQRAL
eukprot:366518-Chlamydomonas_euryale.AAC.2